MCRARPCWLPTALLLLAVLALSRLECQAAGNESNILRLGRPRSTGPTRLELPLNASDPGASSRPRHEFSQNNPELDWRSQVRKVAELEEKTRPKELDLDFMKDRLEKNANSIQWLADLYDPLRWTKIPGDISDECRDDMTLFLNDLKRGKLWAAKLSDASGRYSSQYHFGNGFWLGSSTLCRELNGTEARAGRPFNDSLPFHVQFYVTRMFFMLPSDIETSTRQVFIGLCLPSSCDHSSVKSMLRACADRVERQGEATHRSGDPKIHIVQVRRVPSSDYSPWTDPKFHVLAGISGATLLLMVCATIYEQRGGITGSKPRRDVESLSASNNNERLAEYADKNLVVEELRIGCDGSPAQDNSKELIEKAKGSKCLSTETDKADAPTMEKGILLSCLLAFSPITNGSKIISTEPATKTSLTCLHGLRVLSLGWVVMVHTYLQVFSIAENKILRTVTERNFMFQTISNATFSVDTFFFISGLLVTILFYRSMGSSPADKDNFVKASTSKFVIMILYRFVRLTPSYLFVLGINVIAMKYAMSVTVFSPQIIDHSTCEQFWWRNALYVNSLYPRTEMCMLWSWYMANDMQFYVLGIFLLLLSVRHFRAVVGAVLLLMVSSWFTTFSIAYRNDYVARIQEPFALFDELYDKPWLRAGPYFIGTMTGYVLFKTNCSIKISLLFRTIGWIGSSLIMCSLVYGLYPENLSVTVSSVYASLGHTAWAIAVSFIVIQCCTGAAPLVDKLLSLRIIYPLSRLTYCAYLVHPMIMMFTSTQMDGPLHLHNGIVLIVYFGNFVASYLMAFCISVAFEAPIVNLLKLILSPKKRAR
ncbi:PREDICTED: nose resistant to fluoxetine protein 6-like [Ceratosolen solmsi marchali]|uniref:Nose resistant to fluoxetine protein 6-like n=1 Tax=Ceratosolen solmsi marchali TaxID=326594 RepID=A0AAJ6VJF0_9HYME|nr:PREDICTED: nose resistant to fluoxetine protein 6-like [Ceratosolen solmsi marchali]